MLSLQQAREIADGALAEGRRLSLAPLAVVVLDAGGHLVAAFREPQAGIMRFEIAFAKAWGSLGMGFGSRELATRAEKLPVLISSLGPISAGRIAPSPGGVLITDGGNNIGAVGVSGDLGDQDERCAVAGIKKAGMEPSL